MKTKLKMMNFAGSKARPLRIRARDIELKIKRPPFDAVAFAAALEVLG
jgi:hypothetical protein